MSYLVLARKYRPQNFDQVVKQEHVTRTLANAISADRVAHAILFSGPRGTGKTTVARILAKALNCEQGPAPTPCNTCQSCREITAGSAVDVFEIDGASNNSVDQVRELRENIKYMPAHCRYKIYIIDEVHMLSIAAFNALLKTLEEPPSHVMFIFATTESHKIPITILSRCQRHDFRRIDIESISMQLASLCKNEGFEIAAESLWLMARESGGSMRDALSLLDQVMTCSDGEIFNQQVLETLGIIDRQTLFNISEALFSRDVSRLLDILDEAYDRGYDLKKLYSDLLEHFRNLLVVKIGKKGTKLVDLPAHEIDQMVHQVKEISAEFLNQIFNLLFEQEATIRHSSHPKLALEVVFIRMNQIKPALPIEMLIEKLEHLRQEIVGNQTPKVHDDPGGLSISEAESTDPFGSEKSPQSVSQPTSKEKSKGEATEDVNNPNENLNENWQRILDTLSATYPALAAHLTHSALNNLSGQRLEIDVSGNGFSINMIQRDKNLAILNKVCNDVFGKKMNLSINAKAKRNDEDQVKKKQTGQLKKKALNQPLVADAIEIFQGEIVEVKILQEAKK
jgi:DNA polymerase-3 subunit gamma/tau